MKRFLGILIAVLTVVTLTATMVSARTISVNVNDKAVDFSSYGVAPQIINSRTMVPLRSIFEALGATVEWDDATKTVTSVRGDITVKLTIGAKEMKKNSASIALDSPAVIVDSRTLVPVRAISEAFGCEVAWDDKTSTVSIKAAAAGGTVMGANGDPIKIVCETFEKDEAGFESTNGCYVDVDPLDPDNKALRVDAYASGPNYNHCWVNFEYQAGKTYTIEYDILLGGGVDFDVESNTFGPFTRIKAKTVGHSNQVGGGKMYAEKWIHCRATVKIADDYVYSRGLDSIGVYADPKDETSTYYYIDNFSVQVVE